MNKVSRVKNKNFTTISNVFLRDKSLSIKSKGFLAVVMGLPDDWEFSINGICSILKEGKTAIYSTIDELKQLGYCKVITNRDLFGRILGNDYMFFEEPQQEEQYLDKPYMENPNMDNQPQLNKEIIKETIEEKKENKNKKDKTFNVRADLSYVSEEYIDIWNEWLDYKDEIKKQYKTQRGAKTQYNSLIKYADNNPTLAYAIIQHSIERSWDGLFALSDKQISLFLSAKSPYAPYAPKEKIEQTDNETLIINGQIYK